MVIKVKFTQLVLFFHREHTVFVTMTGQKLYEATISTDKNWAINLTAWEKQTVTSVEFMLL